MVVINYIINVLSLIFFTLLSLTGYPILFYMHKGDTFLSYPRKIWGEFHERLGLVTMFLIVMHLCLHRKWIVAFIKGKMHGSFSSQGKTQVWIALAISFLLLFGLVAASFF